MPDAPAEIRLTEAETIALAYRRGAGGDAWAALVRAVEDALADLAEAERRSLRRDRLVSRGYLRGRVEPAPIPARGTPAGGPDVEGLPGMSPPRRGSVAANPVPCDGLSASE